MSQRRTSHYAQIAMIGYGLCQKVLPKYSHRNSQHRYSQHSVAAAVLLGFYLDVSYRDLEEFLHSSQQVCEALGLGEDIPDHSTLYRMYKRLRMSHLKALNEQLLQALEIQEEAIAIDSTGFSPTQASEHYLSQHSGRPYRHFIKAFYAVGTQSQLILAWYFDRGPNSDVGFLNRLRRAAHPHGQRAPNGRARWSLLADKGFDGLQARPYDLIPPRKGRKRIARPDRQRRAALTDMARLDGLYGQRWKIETVHSVIKRKSGDTIRSRKTAHQRREIAVKALAYNLHR